MKQRENIPSMSGQMTVVVVGVAGASVDWVGACVDPVTPKRYISELLTFFIFVVINFVNILSLSEPF